MRCGFDLYRAFLVDVDEFRDHLKQHGKVSMPVLACDGDHSMFSPVRSDHKSCYRLLTDVLIWTLN